MFALDFSKKAIELLQVRIQYYCLSTLANTALFFWFLSCVKKSDEHHLLSSPSFNRKMCSTMVRACTLSSVILRTRPCRPSFTGYILRGMKHLLSCIFFRMRLFVLTNLSITHASPTPLSCSILFAARTEQTICCACSCCRLLNLISWPLCCARVSRCHPPNPSHATLLTE